MRKLLLTIAALSVIALPVAGCGGNDQAASSAAELVPAGATLYGEATLEAPGRPEAGGRLDPRQVPGRGPGRREVEGGHREGAQGVGRPAHLQGRHRAVARRRGGLLRERAGRGRGFQSVALLVPPRTRARPRTRSRSPPRARSRRRSTTASSTSRTNPTGTELGRGVRRLRGPRQRGRRQGGDRREQGRLDAVRRRRLPECPRPRRETTGWALLPQLARAPEDAPRPGPAAGLIREHPRGAVRRTLDADNDGVVFEATIPEQLGKAFAFFGQGSDLLTDLPADSWLALAQTKFGTLLDYYVDAFAGAAGGRGAIEQQFHAATGLDLQKDVIDWMGDFAVFVRGTSIADLDGALVIETSDEAASGRFIAALERLAKTQGQGQVQVGRLTAPGGGDGFTLRSADIPQPVHVFQKGDRVVFAYGDVAAKDAVDPARRSATPRISHPRATRSATTTSRSTC